MSQGILSFNPNLKIQHFNFQKINQILTVKKGMFMKLIYIFKTPSAAVLASRDLEEAKRSLLVTQAQAEHSAKMVEYYQGVVSRLTEYVREEMKQPK
jgi:hypothetical protein